MNSRKSCPSCGQQNPTLNCYAAISPWVFELANLNKNFYRVGYMGCLKCGTSFFDCEYPENILEGLYSGYRDKKYFTIRNSWDSTYSEVLNSGLTNSTEWMSWRKSAVSHHLLSSGINLKPGITVVDIGGGEGGVIPDFPDGKKYVLDSNKNLKLPSDIIRIDSTKDLLDLKPGLVMCCGLLEHLNDPSAFLVDLIESVSSSCFLYFEVPKGVPSARGRFVSSKLYLKILTKFRKIWNLFNWLELFIYPKFKLHVFPLKCSEHLNFFTDAGLTTLFEKAGLEVIKIASFSTNQNLPEARGVAFSDAWQILTKKLD